MASLLVTVVALVALLACGETGAPPDTPQAVAAPAELSDTARQGETLFNASCAQCHGPGAVGTSQGPTFNDRVYHPGHHADAAFRIAVLRGVRQHHWQFGNMLPVPGLSDTEVDNITCYVREVQRANGIFEGNDFQTVC